MLFRSAGLTIGLLSIFVISSAEAKIPSKLMGKVFFTTRTIKNQTPSVLIRMFGHQKPQIELKRQKNSHWKVTIVAFFRKEAFDGPITLWFFDKGDKAALRNREATHIVSIDGGGKTIFIHDLDVIPDVGFNKDHTYLIHVGQIIGKRSKVYARGQFSLKP